MSRSDGPVRVALYLPTLNMGGTERVTLHLAEGLNQSFEVYLFIANCEGVLISQIPEQVHVVDLKSTRTRFAFLKLYNALKKHDVNVLITSFPNVNFLAAAIKLFMSYRLKLIIREVSTPSAYIKKWSLTYLTFLFSLYVADLIVAVGKGVKEDIRTYFRYHRTNLIAIYSPILKEKSELIPNKLHFANDRKNLVTVARIIPEKGIHTLIKMLYKVNQVIPSRLIIVGPETDVKYASDLRALARILRLEKYIYFYGYSQDPVAEIRQADVFVFASYCEGLPGVLVQAMEEGKRIVSTDCKWGPRELLQDGELGELVPVDDESAFANAVITILQHEPPSEKLRTVASQFYSDNACNEFKNHILKLTLN